MSFGQSLLKRGFTKLEPDLLDRQMELMREEVDFKDAEVLELGCRDGRHSLMALELGAICSFAMDGRPDSFPRGDFSDSRISYVSADARRVERTFGKTFDVILCYGLLYHVPDPGDLIRQMCKMTTRALVISTHCATLAVHESGGYSGRFVEESNGDIDSMEPVPSLWLHPDELKRALDDNGFEVVRWVDYIVSDRPAVWLAAKPKKEPHA